MLNELSARTYLPHIRWFWLRGSRNNHSITIITIRLYVVSFNEIRTVDFDQYFRNLIQEISRSQYPRRLRHELSSLARTMGSWVQIPLRAWMFGVCIRLFCACAVLCLGSGSCDELVTHYKSPTVCKMNMELNKRPGTWMGWKSHWKKFGKLMKQLVVDIP
jgi:hypothetical protein